MIATKIERTFLFPFDTSLRFWVTFFKSVFVSRRHSLSSTKLLSPHSSGEDEEQMPEGKQAMCNREIVRRGALILFCDYVVRII